MINLLIKIADSLDKRGLHVEASQVDELIRKLAKDLEDDFSKSAAKKKKSEKKKKSFPDLSGDGKVTKKDILIGKGIIKSDEDNDKKKSKKPTKKEKEKINDAYDKMISKKRKS